MTKIFFSYARHDSNFAKKLAEDLRAEGIEIWIDQLDIKAGKLWDVEVELALNSASSLLVILSPNSLNSKNVMDEVSYAMESGKIVIPVLLENCTPPLRLRRLQRIDFSTNYQDGLKDLIGSLESETKKTFVPKQTNTANKNILLSIYKYLNNNKVKSLVIGIVLMALPIVIILIKHGSLNTNNSETASTTQPTGDSLSVIIGSQKWMLKNLDVERYQNGDPIPQVTDPAKWSNLTTGAWCYYNNDPYNGQLFGKLYNWYAVNDPRGLAPANWHIATKNEWTTMISFVGGSLRAGGKLKAVSRLWEQPNEEASDSFHFEALPGGYRLENGEFLSLHHEGIWWAPGGDGWRFNTYSNLGIVGEGSNDKRVGFSVRCIKNE